MAEYKFTPDIQARAAQYLGDLLLEKAALIAKAGEKFAGLREAVGAPPSDAHTVMECAAEMAMALGKSILTGELKPRHEMK